MAKHTSIEVLDKFVLPIDGLQANNKNNPPGIRFNNASEIWEYTNNGVNWIGFSNDYTGFEVLANDAVIAAGSVDSATGLTYTFEVPVGMTHWILLRSETNPKDSDVYVTWGDGEKTEVSNLTADDITAPAAGGTTYTIRLQHTYQAPGKYIVKLFGKNYYGFQNAFNGTSNEQYNLISRVLDIDLPKASHLVNLASMAMNSQRLLKVHIPYYSLTNVYNVANLFKNCHNLKIAEGLCYFGDTLDVYKSILNNCWSLETTDFCFPRYATQTSFYTCLQNCSSLIANVSSLFPEQGFISHDINCSAGLQNCKKLSGTVPTHLLWENKDIVWNNPVNMFKGCSDAIRNQVIKSWGGKLPDPVPEPEKKEIVYIGTNEFPTSDAIDGTMYVNSEGESRLKITSGWVQLSLPVQEGSIPETGNNGYVPTISGLVNFIEDAADNIKISKNDLKVNDLTDETLLGVLKYIINKIQ
jgi:hypothetical protein